MTCFFRVYNVDSENGERASPMTTFSFGVSLICFISAWPTNVFIFECVCVRDRCVSWKQETSVSG